MAPCSDSCVRSGSARLGKLRDLILTLSSKKLCPVGMQEGGGMARGATCALKACLTVLLVVTVAVMVVVVLEVVMRTAILGALTVVLTTAVLLFPVYRWVN